ncbi:D-alanyl-D-alanine carboxypeptidase/D-alanyl-D-alanine-endopeptidase [Solibacillus sp. R5-41]|uniref:D-alanyl-D-alanine carboxypeptidase/D-alanyl-D-alanine endopeptidase n=1 Tax=Solibacillus sp. R5-41 TaxID=2048654 RepID=UPI000C126C7F|nr:D-alanyl-D-alanine carboxypeptidase/D-alanyl-D-alanine-endopeptidase [Solibacillus sp. R5-41]ATP39521.1 D-alanyl-D-alanine carboxypeptidase/D-alanyl-D-alanine-endopeptidase [Solibacillus sp. R5-41]
MKKVVSFILLITLCVALPLQSFASISDAVTKNLGNGNVAVTIRDKQTGKIIYEHNGEKLMRPASNMKLLTGAAALDILGEDYRFSTELYIDGVIINKELNGNLYIKGTGDPTLNKDDFLAFAKALKNQGISKINGNIIGDDTYFSGNTLPPGVDKIDESYYFGARTSAITMSQNLDFDASTVIITATPGKVGTKPSYEIIPNLSGMTIANEAKTVSKGQKNTIKIERSYNTNRIIISGNLPQGSSKKEWVTLQDPTKNTLQAIQLTLQGAGIQFAKNTQIKTAQVPADAKFIHMKKSRTLSAIFPAFMKLSNNSIADILVKSMGQQQQAKGSLTAGLQVMQEYGKALNISMGTWILADGSGLSDRNRLTANGLSSLLYEVQQKSYFQTFYQSLPVAGHEERLVGGTLRKRFKTSDVKGKINAKTGYIPNVNTLAGYVTGKSGKTYIFTILLENRSNGTVHMDRMMADIMKNL